MSKKYGLLFLISFIFMSISGIEAQGTGGTVYVIPVKGEIGPAVYQYLHSNIGRAMEDPSTEAIIIEIDTYGGLIESAVSISDSIVNTSIPTIAFVNKKAESAGVLITISADTIVMAPGSTIGSAEPIPNTEKSLSYWTGQLRTVAQQNGRDPQLVAAMADSSIEIPDVVDQGRLLNLTTVEASDLGFTDLVAPDYETILRDLDISYGKINTVELPPRIRLAQLLTNPYVVSLLLSLGFIGILIEIFTPGFGLGGTIGLISFVLYFGGGIMAGNAGWAVVIIFITGIALLLIEAFVPGFGVPGIGGVICIIASIVLGANNLAVALTSLLIAFLLTLVAFVLLLKYAPRNQFFNRIVLSTREKVEDGYVSSGVQYDHYVGQQGIVKTFLRPAGTIAVGEELLDVVSEGDFIEVGTAVKIIKVEGRKIIVRKID